MKSYEDDFEKEEDSENTIMEESFMSESIKELVSDSNSEEIQSSTSNNSGELTIIFSSSDVKDFTAMQSDRWVTDFFTF